jgi:hypothetical protein
MESSQIWSAPELQCPSHHRYILCVACHPEHRNNTAGVAPNGRLRSEVGSPQSVGSAALSRDEHCRNTALCLHAIIKITFDLQTICQTAGTMEVTLSPPVHLQTDLTNTTNQSWPPCTITYVTHAHEIIIYACALRTTWFLAEASFWFVCFCDFSPPAWHAQALSVKSGAATKLCI